MLGEIFEGLRIAHGIAFVIFALFHVWFWMNRGFWVPRYIHVMALIAALIGVGLLSILPAEGPLLRKGVWGYGLAILIFPALVYGTFVVFGGPQAALEAKESAGSQSESEYADIDEA